MNYQKHYNQLIESRKIQCSFAEYYESHHIVPKCLGGSDNKENLILLTAREHYIAHWLLYKMAKNKNEKIKLGNAFSFCCYGRSNKKLTAKQYERTRNISRECAKLNIGRKCSEETKEKMRNAASLRSTISLETKKKMSDAAKNRPKRQLSESTKEKMRNAAINRFSSLEERQKISEKRKGIKFSEEHKQKLAESAKNRPPISEETRYKLKLHAINLPKDDRGRFLAGTGNSGQFTRADQAPEEEK